MRLLIEEVANYKGILNSISEAIPDMFWCKDLEGPNGVYTPTNTMTNDNYKDFSYPVDGWYWFDTENEAYGFFGLEKPE